MFALLYPGASPNQENVKGKTPIELAKSETTLTLLCPLHYAAERGMLDNLVSLVAKVLQCLLQELVHACGT